MKLPPFATQFTRFFLKNDEINQFETANEQVGGVGVNAQQLELMQVINPNPLPQQTPKFQVRQMQLPIESFQPSDRTVLTVAYSPQDHHQLIPNQSFPEGVTVLQPQDLQYTNKQQQQQQNCGVDENNIEGLTYIQEPDWDNIMTQNNQTTISDLITQVCPLNLEEFFGSNPASTIYESELDISKTSENIAENETNDVDGTKLFCCPECEMAYPEKENLEEHLSMHKIERRWYICDICGAGLKRKECLKKHKLVHNPVRPFICSVCMKKFKRKADLKRHFGTHSGQKNEICGECGKGFYRKSDLKKHSKLHQQNLKNMSKF